jgi:hypothetical protein
MKKKKGSYSQRFHYLLVFIVSLEKSVVHLVHLSLCLLLRCCLAFVFQYVVGHLEKMRSNMGTGEAGLLL